MSERSPHALDKPSEYEAKLAAEGAKWGRHLEVEAAGEWHAWLDHPMILEHYRRRAMVDGLTWENWVRRHLGGPAQRSLDLGCGAGERSFTVFRAGATRHVDGFDVSAERIAAGERQRAALGIPGRLQLADMNQVEMGAGLYDLIFSAHSFHHFVQLETICERVRNALTPSGLFVLEEYVGPTQFQWTDEQIEIVRALLALVPPALRRFRWDALKTWEGRPTPEEVAAVSPFESIRSAEIAPIFRRYFDVVAEQRLGGTIQHLLFNGIVHNFRPDDPAAARIVSAICHLEDGLIDSELLPSDFMLLIGRRREGRSAAR